MCLGVWKSKTIGYRNKTTENITGIFYHEFHENRQNNKNSIKLQTRQTKNYMVILMYNPVI